MIGFTRSSDSIKCEKIAKGKNKIWKLNRIKDGFVRINQWLALHEEKIGKRDRGKGVVGEWFDVQLGASEKAERKVRERARKPIWHLVRMI